MDDKRIDILKNSTINKAVKKMAAPAIVGMLVMAIYNVVDSIFVSWLGGYEIAAIQVVLPIMLISSSIGLAFGVGGGTYVSRLLGRNNREEADSVASVSFFTGLIISIFLMALSLILLHPILQLFGADANTEGLAKTYGTYIILGFGFTILNMVMNNMLRSEGSARFSMIGMAIGSVVNIILDPILIFGFDMGIAGAAIATTFSQAVTTVVLLSMYIRKKSIIKIGLTHFKPTLKMYKEILVVGVPTFFRQVLVSISLGMLNNAATQYGGTDMVSAFSIVVKVTLVPNYIIFGIGQGFQPVAGYNFGAKDKERVLAAFRYTLKISTITMLSFLLLFFVFDDLVFDIFKSTDTVREYGKPALKWYMFGFLFLGISNTISVFYQAIGKGKEAFLLSVARQGIFFIPLLFILPRLFGVDGLIVSQAFSDILAFLLSIALIIPFTKSQQFKLLTSQS